MLSSFQQGIIIVFCVNVIAVLGMSILTGFTRLFSFGNAGFMSIGAYASAILTVNYHVPFWLAVPIALLTSALVAYLLGSLTIRLKGDYFLITCLGFGEGVRVLFNQTKGLTGGSNGFSGIEGYTTLPIAVGSAIAAFILAWCFIHSKYGRKLTAIREDEMAARMAGIHVIRYKKMSFVISAGFAGWAGALYAHYIMYITPAAFNLAKSCELVTTTVIGGLGSLTGSVLGTVVVTLLPELFRSLSEYRMLFYGITVVVIILLRPGGLCGYWEFSLTRLTQKIRKKWFTKESVE